MTETFFPKRPDAKPTIYAYKILDTKNRKALLKVGYTTRDTRQRVKEQLQTSGLNYEIVLEESALRDDGTDGGPAMHNPLESDKAVIAVGHHH